MNFDEKTKAAANAGTGATSDGTTPIPPGVYVTAGAAVAVGVGGVLLGTLLGWAWRGHRERELSGERAARRLAGTTGRRAKETGR